MRTIFFTRGLPGSGKSTYLEKAGLQPFTISTDNIRQLRSGLAVHPVTHELALSTSQDAEPFSLLKTFMSHRMQRGELIVLDATFLTNKDSTDLVEISSDNSYNLVCLDFKKVPYGDCIENNLNRPKFKQVPDFVMQDMHNRLPLLLDNENIDYWDATDPLTLTKIQKAISPDPKNLDNYKNIIVIGDLQGCITDLLSAVPYIRENNPDNFYVFVGDMCDRGVENDKVMQHMLDNFHDHDNTCFLRGNHELHLMKWANGEQSFSREFNEFTQPQLEAANINKDTVKNWLSNLQDFLYFERNKQRFLVTHSGLGRFIPELGLLSSKDLHSGVGGYICDIDEVYTKKESSTDQPVIQIHGHRNAYTKPIHASKLSYNLEGGVEFGGDFRLLNIDSEGHIQPLSVPNSIFKQPEVVRFSNLPSIKFKNTSNKIQDSDLEELCTHPLIREKICDSRPHISSFNFSRQAFTDGLWDSTNIRARGLFINTETNEIVARSYDKFFNVNEKPETQEHILAHKFKYPVQAYFKENGFLGILGFDTKKKDLIFCSKSSMDTDFSKYFENLVRTTHTKAELEQIRQFLNYSKTTMVFEVNDPVNDPHIIDYDKPHIVLLDIIKNSLEFEKVPYHSLLKIADKFGMQAKKRGPELRSHEQFRGWLNAVQKDESPAHHEGYVLEDCNGLQAKLKSPYYNFWKRMRSVKDRINTIRGTAKPLKRTLKNEEERKFALWCIEQDSDTLKAPITKVRKLYNQQKDSFKPSQNTDRNLEL